MRYLVTGGQMKLIDRHTIENIGIPSLVLMERAAYAVAEEALKYIRPGDTVWVACTAGNNGADGVAAARMLFLRGCNVSVLLAGDKSRQTPEFKTQLQIAENLGMDVIEFRDFIPGNCDIIIDALFGVGLSRNVEGIYREFIEMLESQDVRTVIAVDIPSGIHADTGSVMGVALHADVTVTFGYEKLGTVLYPGREYSGRVITADIGFPEVSLKQAGPQIFTYEKEDLQRIPKRVPYSNKGTYGRVLIIAGSKNMSGAAYLSALAAYRMGAGLVRIFTVEENREILQGQLPEAVIVTYERSDAASGSDRFKELLKAQCALASVIVLGPGISREPYTRTLVEEVLIHAYVPIILDADGLNTVASYPHLTGYYTENIIVTPHLGEMARLTGTPVCDLAGELLPAAREYADRYGITCVLKDAATVAALKDGRTYVNTSGNSAMAKAGAGDVLTGIIAGLLALGMEESESAAMGVYIHGLAGDGARKKTGQHGLLARDLAAEIAGVIECALETAEGK